VWRCGLLRKRTARAELRHGRLYHVHQAYGRVPKSRCGGPYLLGGARLRVTAITLLVALLLCPTFSAETESGTVCVIPNSEKPPTIISPGGEYNPATLLLRIDKRPAIHWPHKETFKVAGLDLKERHLVVLISDGKRIQSFWFRFAEFRAADHLCISFDGYQGVNLQEADPPYCKCK
jgi:hypothetical protein